MPKSVKTFAIFCMVWSVLGGVLGLLVIRGIQIAMGSGAVGPFPWILAVVVALAVISLSIIFVAMLRQRSWTKTGLAVILVAVLLATIVGWSMGRWASDALPTMLFLEAIWLGPWLLLLFLPIKADENKLSAK